MAAKAFLISVTLVAAYVGFLGASPTRRQYKAFTEATASDQPVTNDGAAWDDNDEFDLDGEGWFSQAVVSPSSAPQKSQEYNEYEDYSRGNVMADFGEDDEEEDEDGHLQDAEEDDGSRNDSEFLFLPPRDTRLVLEDDDDDQSGPIKVRHTGRSSYPRTSETVDNSVESVEDDAKEEEEHPYEFTIDEDDKDDEDDEDENDGTHKEDDSEEEAVPRHDDDEDDEDEFVSEGGDDSDMFDNPEEEAAQVIYGDHVFLY